MISFLKLIRYKNLLMVLLTMVLTKYALIHSFITNSYISHFEFTLLSLSVILITAGGYIINDIYDVETDKINKPSKIFIDVNISKKNACRSYLLFNIIGLIVGVYLSFVKLKPLYSLYFIFTAFALYFYSKHLKTKLLVGNILVSTLCCITILIIIDFEYSYQLNNSQDFFSIKVDIIYGFILTIFSFITTFIREIIKDIEDINGDLKIKAKTLPIVIGIKRASKVAFFFSSILFLLLLILLQSIKSEILFLGYGIIFILFPLINFLYKLWFAKSKKDFSKLSKLMKVIMLLGILSMLLFRLIDV